MLMANLFSSGAPLFLSSATILLVVWSTNGNGSALTSKASSKVIRTNRARCALKKEILDLLNEESISGARSGRVSL